MCWSVYSRMAPAFYAASSGSTMEQMPTGYGTQQLPLGSKGMGPTLTSNVLFRLGECGKLNQYIGPIQKELCVESFQSCLALGY